MPHEATQPQPIRPTWGDLAEVARIQTASFRRDLAYKRWMLVFFWLMPGVTFLITKQNDSPTGCIISDTHRGKVRIMNIAVHPDHRQKGIGRLLMTTVIERKPEYPVVLMVQEHNTSAQELYAGLGFVRTGFHPAYYGTGNPGIEMTLKRS